MSQFPNQNIAEVKKDKDWIKLHFDYARALLKNSEGRISRFTRLDDVYNGKISPASTAYLTNQYGKKNKTKYISYRIGRPKIDLINNEFLQRPLESTVYTINESAKTARLDNFEFMLGAAHVKPITDKMKENGVDPLEGMTPPDLQDENAWAKMSTKDKHQELMQVILNEQIPALRVKEKLAKIFQDIEIKSMGYGKIDVDYLGNEDVKRIDPRFAIFEEIENDTFIEKSVVMGHLEIIPIHKFMLSSGSCELCFSIGICT